MSGLILLFALAICFWLGGVFVRWVGQIKFGAAGERNTRSAKLSDGSTVTLKLHDDSASPRRKTSNFIAAFVSNESAKGQFESQVGCTEKRRTASRPTGSPT